MEEEEKSYGGVAIRRRWRGWVGKGGARWSVDEIDVVVEIVVERENDKTNKEKYKKIDFFSLRTLFSCFSMPEIHSYLYEVGEGHLIFIEPILALDLVKKDLNHWLKVVIIDY